MNYRFDIQDIYHKLNELKIFENISLLGSHSIKGTTIVEEKCISLNVCFSEGFPLELPIYFLNPPDIFGFIPHVFSNGYICYIQKEGIVVDYKNINGVLQETFQKVTSTLSDGILGKNKFDFVEEFNAYWNYIDGKTLASKIDIGHKVKKIKIYYENDIGIIEDEKTISNLPYKNALFIPILKGALILPPKYGSVWDNRFIVNNVIQHISKSNKRKLNKITRQKASPNEIFIFALTQKNGYTLFGLEYTLEKGESRHPLFTRNAKCKINPLNIMRIDRKYLLERGGGNLQVSDKKIIVIGCGSVGGYIVEGLSKTGVLNFDLVDDDLLLPENIYRHILGFNYRFQPKAHALYQEMTTKLKNINIITHLYKVEHVIKNNLINFDKSDLVIVATGNPTVNRYLNEYFIKNHHKTPVIFTWLEPYGIGGHAILTNNNRKNGCYECLFDKELYNQASFAERNQYFSKSINGCGSAFTPFGVTDAIETANLAVRLAINTLLEIEEDNPLLSWKGQNNIFLDAGYQLSSRYLNSSLDSLHENRYEYKKPNCSICQKN